MKKITFIATLFISTALTAQNVGINATGASPDASAALDVSMTNKGILIPRVALTAVNSASPITSPATSLMVYNTATAGTAPNNVTPGFYYWNGTSWSKLVPSTAIFTLGDVKNGYQTTDHNGWVKMDGRALSTLTATQQTAAAALGFSGSLPNATDKVLKQKATLNSTGGANTVTIAQSNLPNFNMTASTTTNGSHTHTGSTTTAGGHTHTHTDYYYAENNGTNWGWAGSSSGMDWDNRGYSITGTTSYNGDHTHSITANANGDHTHSVTVNSGGGGTALTVEDAYIGVNTFIYLGN